MSETPGQYEAPRKAHSQDCAVFSVEYGIHRPKPCNCAEIETKTGHRAPMVDPDAPPGHPGPLTDPAKTAAYLGELARERQKHGS